MLDCATMKTTTSMAAMGLATIVLAACGETKEPATPAAVHASSGLAAAHAPIYDIEEKDIDGATVRLDRYAGKGIPDGKVSLSLRLTFRAPDKTLTDAEVQSAMESVLSALKDTHGAIQR